MARRETEFTNAIRVAVAKAGGRIFRNHRGKHLTMDGKRVVTTGLFPGASDLIGWMPVVVTEDMVGSQLAVFLSVEGKIGDASVTAEQGGWLDAVNLGGGIGIVAREHKKERPPEAADFVMFRIAEIVRSKFRVRVRI